MNRVYENNQVEIMGEVVSDFEFNHEVYGCGGLSDTLLEPVTFLTIISLFFWGDVNSPCYRRGTPPS